MLGGGEGESSSSPDKQMKVGMIMLAAYLGQPPPPPQSIGTKGGLAHCSLA